MLDLVGFDSDRVGLIYFVEVQFESGWFRANSSPRNITIMGNVYQGVGNLGGIGESAATTGTAATATKLTLQGIPLSFAGLVVEENSRNRPVNCFVLLVDEAEQPLSGFGDPYKFFAGLSDQMTMQVSQFISVQLSASSKLINWNKPVSSRYTHEDQQSKFPLDNGFKFVNSLATTKLQWGT
jgi:hypothetical protein